jgi:hypothetical protein
MSEKRLPVVESGWTRRDVLRGAAAALTTYGVLDLQGAAVAHAILQEAQAGGGYEPRWFKAHEWETVVHLADLILPADTVSVSASAARVPEFIDLMCSESVRLQRVFSSGLLWLDAYTRSAGEGRFVEATAGRQAEILDLLAAHGNESEPPGYEGLDESVEYAGFFDYGVEAPSELQPGATFFGWIRRLTVDGFYSSPEGIEDVGYLGNGYSRRYTVPQEAIQYALSRSPFAEE